MRRFLLPLLLACLVPAGGAAAQDLADYDYANLTFSGVGLHLAGVFANRMEPALGLNVRADLGLLGPNVRIAPGIGFWAARMRGSEVRRMAERIEAACDRGGSPCPGLDLGEIRVSDFYLDLDAHYLWTTDFGLEPYAGAGVSLHVLNGSGDFIDDTFVEELLDAVSPGLNLVGGVELPLGAHLRLLGEARGVLTGSVRYLSVGIGASWQLPANVRRPVVPGTGTR